jgi:putative addiction module CopG family antidote
VPTRNVNLTAELDRLLLKKVKSGRYENASEVVRAALRTLEREEQPYEAKLAAIDEGEGSGLAKGDVFARARKTLKVPTEPREPALHERGPSRLHWLSWPDEGVRAPRGSASSTISP